MFVRVRLPRLPRILDHRRNCNSSEWQPEVLKKILKDNEINVLEICLMLCQFPLYDKRLSLHVMVLYRLCVSGTSPVGQAATRDRGNARRRSLLHDAFDRRSPQPRFSTEPQARSQRPRRKHDTPSPGIVAWFCRK